ncbi:ankyrin repeat domain-containing protein [Candidatus Berkiella aquae]|nr:ankyrin repeat domain-containing protein [Candidatus Berkiella aquae]MCS5712214.1 ankyrin repeat domain-containing protein [Candidatus Berkiella aquae]
MFEKLLSTLKKRYRNPTIALKVIKTSFNANDPQLKQIIAEADKQSALSADVLFAAANSGYPAILTYLLRTGFNATKTLPPWGHNVLHHCVSNGLNEMVEIILHNAPLEILHAQTREGATPLFLATQKGDINLVKKLLALGASVNTSDIHGLTPIGLALVSMNPVLLSLLLAHPTSCAIPADLPALNRLLWSISQQKPNANRIRCLNLFFAAGAGLAPDYIPDEILALYSIKRSDIKDFLLIGQETLSSGETKKRIIVSQENFANHYHQSEWHFETEQIVRTFLHPKLHAEPLLLSLRDLLATEIAGTSIPQVTFSLAKAQFEPPYVLKQLSFEELEHRFQSELTLLDNATHSIMSMPQQDPTDTRFMALTICALQSTHELVSLSQFMRSTYQTVFQRFNIFISVLMPTIQKTAPLDALPILNILDEEIAWILKLHADNFKVSDQNLYNSLIDARALVCARITRAYLAMGQHDVAINLALETMALNDQMLIDNTALQASADVTKAMCLASATEVYIAQGWMNKAHKQTVQALQLLRQGGLYEELSIQQAEYLAKLLATNNRIGSALALLTHAIDYLQSLFLLTQEQALVVAAKIPELKKLHADITQMHFFDCVDFIKKELGPTCDVNTNDDTNEIYLTVNIPIFVPHLQTPYFDFLENNAHFQQITTTQLMINQSALYLKAFRSTITAFANVLTMTVPTSIDTMAGLIAKLELTPHEETYGFEKPLGFTPIVPITSRRLPNETLFITMPEDSEAFAPFYKLIRNTDKSVYFPVAAIAEKGLNQHGIKLGTKTVSEFGVMQKVAYGRLKTGETERATGIAEQTIPGKDGKVRKLYVMREVYPKKKEQRRRYQ